MTQLRGIALLQAGEFEVLTMVLTSKAAAA